MQTREMKTNEEDYHVIDNSLSEKVLKKSGENVYSCYQCGKCTSGCPSHSFMENGPSELIRFVQLGMAGKIKKGNTIWICLSCQTCTTRCPMGIDIAHIIDTLKIMMQDKEIRSHVKYPRIRKNVELFNSLWMKMLKYIGRMYEPGLVGIYNLLAGNPSKDLGLAFKMLKKGKLNLLPSIKKPSLMTKMFLKAKRLK